MIIRQRPAYSALAAAGGVLVKAAPALRSARRVLAGRGSNQGARRCSPSVRLALG
jgi:hypothetical protein